MFCRNCGKELGEGAVFCHHCGKKINPSPVSTNTQPVSENDKFQEKTYIFKSLYMVEGRGANVFDLIFAMPKVIKGIETPFVISDDMIIITEEKKYQKKVTAVPYNEITSFEFKNNFSILMLIEIIGCLLASLVALIMLSTIVGILCFAYTLLIAFTCLVKTVFIVNVSDGRKIKIKLKRIGSKEETQKNEFSGELNKMIANSTTLQNITKEQSKIIIGYTKADWKSVVSDLTGTVLGNIGVNDTLSDIAGEVAGNVAEKAMNNENEG